MISFKLKKFFVVIGVGFFAFFASGCFSPKMAIPAEALMNKNKAEIIEIAFAEDAPKSKSHNNQLNICAASAHHGGYVCMRFKTVEDALQEWRLMDSNVWKIYKTTSPWSYGIYYWQVSFKDDKVFKVEKVRLSDF